MQTITEPARELPVVTQVDVLVIGGGPAGFIAATAAARLGCRTMLVERYGCLGGLATGGLVLYMDCIADKEGHRLIGGLPWESLERLREMDKGLAADGPLRLHVDSELYQIVADQLCLEANVEFRLHSWAVSALVKNQRVTGVIVESKSGRQAILSKICIDATGDGDIAAFAGASYDMDCQRIGLNYNRDVIICIRYRDFVAKDPDEARSVRAKLRDLGGFPLVPNSTPHSDAGVFWINVLGLASRQRMGQDEGTVHELFAGELSAIDVEDLTFVQVDLRRRIVLSIDYYRRNVPGFEDVRLLGFASQLGVRESRRITGEYMLSRKDVVAGRTFEDTVGMAGVSFSNIGYFNLPYRCLVPRDLDGLLVAGRCISTDHWTQQASRLIPAAMMSGQAAGTAAALALGEEVPARALNPAALRAQLLTDGAILDL